MNSKYNSKGITLLVLVITVVVMLLLAAIVINYTLGDNGIFEGTQKSKYMTYVQALDDTIKAYPAAKLVKGAYVRNVIEYSPAEKAGIKVGDIIVKADGKTVSSYNELNTIKNSHKIGDTIEIVVNRNGEEKTFTLTLVEQ